MVVHDLQNELKQLNLPYILAHKLPRRWCDILPLRLFRIQYRMFARKAEILLLYYFCQIEKSTC